jgi:hypothetical protein
LKSSDLGGKEKARPRRAIIVPQTRIGEDTTALEQKAPELWKYFLNHRTIFEKRKSSIYEQQPPFSIFGIGDYSFAPYKVAISGMYKQVKFRAVGPINGKPTMFDDTCYFIACPSAQHAAFIASLLNDPLSLAFIHSIVFWDSKRPITKKILQRIDLAALLDAVDQTSLLSRATGELQHLVGETSVRQLVWPHDVRVMLNGPSNPITVTAGDESSNDKAVQLQLM